MPKRIGTVVLDEQVFEVTKLSLADGAFQFEFTVTGLIVRPWAGTDQLYTLNDPAGKEVYLGRLVVEAGLDKLGDNQLVTFTLNYRVTDKVTEGAKRLLEERNLRAG